MRHGTRCAMRALALAAGIVGLQSTLFGADRSWNTMLGGTFSVAANWTGGAVPGASDRAFFNLGSSGGYTVTFVTSPINDSLYVQNDRVTFDLATRTYSLSNGTTALAVGLGPATTQFGRLTLLNGTLSMSGLAYISNGSNSFATLTVGSGGNLITGPLAVGSTGPGTILLVGGGVVSSTSASLASSTTASGFASVSGSGSAWTTSGNLDVGSVGSATLVADAGGAVSCAGLSLGSSAGSAGTVLIAGSASSVSTGTLVVGRQGAATLSVTAGSLTSTTATIADSTLATGSGTVSLASALSSWTNTATLTVGKGAGAASLLLSGGAQASVGNIILGDGTQATGTVRISGAGSALSTGTMTLGATGAGTLQLTNGAAIVVNGHLGMADPGTAAPGPTAPAGNLLIDGATSRLTVNGNANIGVAGPGQISILNGASFSSGIGNIGAGGGAGTVVLNGPGSRWAATSIAVGGAGAGLLDVGPGCSVSTGSQSTFTIGSFGTVRLNGGTLAVGGLSNSGVLEFNSGTILSNAASFTLASAGSAGVLTLTAGKAVRAANVGVLGAGQTIVMRGGVLGAGTLANSGTIILDDPASVISVGALSNSGVLRGDGGVDAGALTNNSFGEIRVSAGEELAIGASAFTNSGQINLFGGLIETNATINNAATGRINGRGVLRAGAIANSATIAFSADTADVFGPLTNNPAGKTIVTGNSTSTFWDDVANSPGSEFRVSLGSTAVFIGNVTGLGQFSGPGTKIFEGGASAGPLATAGSTMVGPAGSLSAVHVREQSLSIEGSARILPDGTSDGTSKVCSLQISASGQLDLSDNDLIIDYGGLSPLSTVRQMLLDGRLISSSTTSTTGIGYADNATLGLGSFSGQVVDPTSVLVKFTYFGDANLDGQVDITDLGKLATHWQTAGTWLDGDFDYSGFIDITDLGKLATNWQAGVGNPMGPSLQEALACLGLPAPLVPEPQAATFVGLCLVGLLTRRSR